MTWPTHNLTAICDAAACSRLLALLDNAVRDLRSLDEDPVIVASCPARFNGVSNDVDWRAVRVGSFFSERQDYIERPEVHDNRLRHGPESARMANRVLETLEAGGWRLLYQQAFGYEYLSPEEIIALVVESSQPRLVLSNSYNGKSAVYVPAKDLVHINCCDRPLSFDPAPQ